MIYLRFCQFWENYNKRLKLLAECVCFFFSVQNIAKLEYMGCKINNNLTNGICINVLNIAVE